MNEDKEEYTKEEAEALANIVVKGKSIAESIRSIQKSIALREAEDAPKGYIKRKKKR